MKSFRLLGLIALTFLANSVFAQTKTETFKVFGNCEMCKKRIESAVKSSAVTQADWNVKTKQMTVTYDSERTNINTIQQQIAAIGHDTEKFVAANSIYQELPGCCQYERGKSKESARHLNH